MYQTVLEYEIIFTSNDWGTCSWICVSSVPSAILTSAFSSAVVSKNVISPLTKKKIVDFNDTSKYHVDHIIPISKWLKELHGQDPNHISNLQLIEKEVNLKKSNKIEKSS